MKERINILKIKLSGSGTLFLLSVFLVFSFPASSQPGNPATDKLAGRLHSLAKNSPPELVYLQTSKGIYETGEDLWFKAYLLDAQYLIPSMLSRTLYLQLLNEKNGQAVWQEKYGIDNGFTDGHVYINDTLSEGSYLFAAYTPHSFFADSTEFKAARKITVKKDMEPRVSVTAKFSKPSFGKGDSIGIDLLALSGQQKPLYAEITAVLRIDGQEFQKLQLTTDRNGEVFLGFNPGHTGEGLTVAIKAKHTDAEENIVLNVPFHNGSPVQFSLFPEGGNLVAGLHSKLAFKAVGTDGNPLGVAGTLFEDDKPLLEFKSAHAGMGSLDFTPLAGKRYHIRLSVPETDSAFFLPEVYPEGITMQLSGRGKEYLEFIVSQSPGLKKAAVYLQGQLRGVVCCMAAGTLDKELRIKIPLKEFLQQGIAEFTLFDGNLLPVAERLVYVNPGKKLYIEAKPDKEKYETREKVVLKIKVADQNGQPVQTNLGVSVYDKLYQNPGDPKNILSHCYLSSQLKGKVYDPAYYFDNKNEGREEALDLLLLTQGWRRYIWGEQNLRPNGEVKRPVIFDGTEGEVHATKKQKKARGVQQFIMAFNPGENGDMDLIASDSAGKFMVTPGHLKTWQGGYVYLKPMVPEEFGPRISLAEPFQDINKIMKAKETTYPLSNKTGTLKEEPTRAFVAGSNVIELGEVIVKGKKINPFRDKYMGQLDSIAKLDLNDDWVCKHGFLHNYKPGYAHLVGSGPPYRICSDTIVARPIEGKTYQLVKYEDVGRQDGKWILTDLISVEYHYPEFTDDELLKMNNLCRVKAYYGKREFYQPNYDKESASDVLPDTRNTLLWAPSVVTDEKGEATLEFFCSDINTGFVGKIEGVGGNGLLGTGDFEFIVRKTKPFKWED